jgi:hypothetical protein
VFGRVHDAAQRPVPAVLTLLDEASHQIDTSGTDEQGAYRLSAPNPGRYLLVCTPPVSRREHAATGPCQATWIRLDGTPRSHNILNHSRAPAHTQAGPTGQPGDDAVPDAGTAPPETARLLEHHHADRTRRHP